MAEFRVDTDKLQQCSMQIQELSRRVSRSSSEVEAVISRLKMDGGVRTSLRQTSQKIYDESVKMQKLGNGLTTVANTYRNAESRISGEKNSEEMVISVEPFNDISLLPGIKPGIIWPFPSPVRPRPRPSFPLLPTWCFPRPQPFNPGPILCPPVPVIFDRYRKYPPYWCIAYPQWPQYLLPTVKPTNIWIRQSYNYKMPNLQLLYTPSYLASHNIGLGVVGSTRSSWRQPDYSHRKDFGCAVLGRMAI